MNVNEGSVSDFTLSYWKSANMEYPVLARKKNSLQISSHLMVYDYEYRFNSSENSPPHRYVDRYESENYY
jgi:hypothetical protein